MFRFTIRDVLWLTVVAALGVASLEAIYSEDRPPPIVLDGPSFPRLCLSHDGKRLAIGGWNDGAELKVYDAQTWRMIHKFSPEGIQVTGLTFSADDKQLIAAVGGDLVVWNLSTGETIARLKRHSDDVVNVALSADGKHIISIGWDGRACVWDAASFIHLEDLEHRQGDGAALYAISVDPASGRIAIVGRSGFFRVWNGPSDNSPTTILENEPISMDHVAFSPDGKTVIALGDGDKLIVATVGKAGVREQKLPRNLYGLAWLSDGKRIAVGLNRTVLLVQVDDGKIVGRLPALPTFVNLLLYDRVNDRLLAADLEGRVVVWDKQQLRDQE